MLPLYIFIFIWLVAMGLYVILTTVSVVQMFRYGTAGTLAYFSTFFFLVMSIAVFGLTLMVIQGVDWNAPVSFGGLVPTSLFSF